LKGSSARTENVRVNCIGDNSNLASLHTGHCEGFAVEFAGCPQLIDSVATLGPAFGNSIGAECGATDAAPAVEVEIPTRGGAGLIENAFGEIKTIVEQIPEIPANRSQTGSVRIQLLSAERGDLNWELPLGQTNSQRAVFGSELGLARNICVNDYAGVAIASCGGPAISGSF
jgi:hypothetical protein